MNPRTAPDNDDWTRRYLRRLKIPCEGDQLRAAIQSLDGPTWRRLKNAWRRHQCNPYGDMIERVFIAGKRLGPIWLRLIAWGVISEEDAHLLASQTPRSSPGHNFYSDSGAKFCLGLALDAQVEAVRQGGGKSDLEKWKDAVAAWLRQGVHRGLRGESLDAHVVAELTPHLGRLQVEMALDSLKADGDYDRVVREALAEE